MELRFNHPEDAFRATKAGAGLSSEDRCSHGTPAIALHFYNDKGDTEEDCGVLLPACVAPGLFGAAIGLIGASGGPEAAEAFVVKMLAAANQTALAVAARQVEAASHCCEASFNTGGREHTCRTDSPS